MKKLLFTLLISITTLAYSQTPQQISYQGVARNTSGTVLANQPIGIRFDIHQGSASGSIVFSETHTGVLTNGFGLFTTYIGSISNLSVINWATNSYFIEVSIDPNTGTFSSLGSQQLMSVPYALNAGSAPAPAVSFTNNILSVGGNTTTISSGTTYTAGTGINVTGNTITNAAPDQIVTITPAGSASVSGTYPNFTVNTPTIQTYSAGNGIDITGGVISNTAIPVTPTITSTGIAVVTPTTGNNFTISVGQPTLSYSNATNVLSLTHDGATITTATLSGTGSNTVSVVGIGLATVTPTSGSTFTVSVPTPVYNQATGVLGFGTNTVIATPTLTLSGTTLTSGASTNSVNLASLPGLWTAPTATTVVTTNSLSLVGIGNNTPTHKLDVTANTTTLAAIHGYNIGSGISSTGVFGEHSSNGIGVYGQSISGQGIWGKSTSNAGVYGESVSGDAGKFLMTGTGSSYGIQVQTNGSGAALYAKSFNASALAARFDGNAVITHTSTSASPHINLVSPTITDFGRVKFSNTGSTGYFSIEGRNNTGGAADAFNIAHNNGANERQVFLINGNRQVFVNNLNFPLATFHVMTSVATATGGIASEGFLQAGQINLIRNNQTAATRLQVNLGDEIGKINFAGFDGSGFGDGAKIYAKATETVTSSNKGTELIFAAVPTGTNTNKDAFKINGLGQLEVISSIRIPGSPAVTAGQVLTAIDALGNASWQTPSAPVGPWIQSAGTVTLGVATSSVGIGIASPTAKLHILNTNPFSQGLFVQNNAATASSAIEVTQAGSSTGITSIINNPTNSQNSVYAETAGTGVAFGAKNTNASNTAYAGIFDGGLITRGKTINSAAFALRAQSSSSVDLLVVRNDSKVGIGTNNPSAQLTILNSTTADEGFLVTNNTTNNGIRVVQNGTGNGIFAGIYNSSSSAKAIEAQTDGTGSTIGASNTGSGSAGSFAISNATNTAAALYVSTIGTGNAIYAANSSSTAPTADFANSSADVVRAISSGGLGRALVASSNSNGTSAVDITNTGTGSALGAYKNAGSTGGNVANFANNSILNGDDVLRAHNTGTAAAIHASNNAVDPTSALTLWVENGHIKATQATAAVVTTVTATGGLSATGVALTLGTCNDVKGSLTAVCTTTGMINPGGQVTFRVSFNKSYSVNPTVVVTPNTDPGQMSYYISNINTGFFNVTFKNNTASNLTGPSFTFGFNYMVIE